MESNTLKFIFGGTFDITGWDYKGSKNNCVYVDIPIEGLHQKVYERVYGEDIVSIGIFSYNAKPAYIAWGYKDDVYCSFHALVGEEGKILSVMDGCPDITPLIQNRKLIGFTLNKKHQFLSSAPSSAVCDSGIPVSPWYRIRQFLPLVGAFAGVLLWVWFRWQFGYIAHWHDLMLEYMAGFFFIFGGLKVLSWESFTRSFRLYDPIAKVNSEYARAYPAIEIALGLMFYLRFHELLASAVTALIMGIGAIGIYRALRSGRTYSCACVGGYFSTPLTPITLIENIVMVVMSVGMFF